MFCCCTDRKHLPQHWVTRSYLNAQQARITALELERDNLQREVQGRSNQSIYDSIAMQRLMKEAEVERLTAALQVATTGEVLLARKLSEQAMELQAANEDAERLIESLFKDVGARKQVLALHQQRLAASDDALAHGSEPPSPAAECAHLPVDVLRWAISAASMHLVRIGGLTRAHAEWCRNCGAVSVNSEPWMLANTGGSSI